MAGCEVPEVFMGFSGTYGDRCYAIKNSAGRKGFPYLNANAQHKICFIIRNFTISNEH
jgi:hypothetical protein